MIWPNKGQKTAPIPCSQGIIRRNCLRKMVMPDPDRQMQNSTGLSRAGPIVAFDFDGTLTVSDSFQGFLRWRAGAVEYYAGLIRLVPDLIRYLFNRSRRKLKAAMVRIYLAGLPRETLEREAAEYAAVAAPMLLRPDALKTWRRHRQEGCRMIIVTASPDILVWPFARGLGADLLLGSRLAFDEEGRVTGEIDGENCRGMEKVRRIREALGLDINVLAAYGDTDGDIEMLAMAEERFMRLFSARPSATPLRSP